MRLILQPVLTNLAPSAEETLAEFQAELFADIQDAEEKAFASDEQAMAASDAEEQNELNEPTLQLISMK